MSFLNDIVELNEAIENFGYLDMPEDVLEESLLLHIRKDDIDRLLQLPLGKIFSTLNNNDLFDEIKESGKKMSDYKLSGSDMALTINKMKIFVYINGNNDQKELMKDKITALTKKIEKAHKSANEKIDIPYGSIKSIYSLYKRVEKASLKEESAIWLDESSAVSDAKYALKHDPEEFVYRDAINFPPLKQLWRMLRHGDSSGAKEIAMRRVEKIDDYKELSDLAKKIKSELEKSPIDREKTSKLLAEFKTLYRKSTLKKDLKQEMKIEKINSKRNTLSESVTFIDNAGTLHTTSTEDYAKSMHNAHQLTNIELISDEDYEKELANFYKDFKLVEKFKLKKDKDGNITSIYEN